MTSQALDYKVFHYTAGVHVPAIVASGILRASNAGSQNECERPLLWFSSHQQWEPTATKLIQRPGGQLARLTFAEQARRFGCVRFGLSIDDRRLLSWESACAFAGIPRDERRNLERYGRSIGGNPVQWRAVPQDLNLSELTFEVYGAIEGASWPGWLSADPVHIASVAAGQKPGQAGPAGASPGG